LLRSCSSNFKVALVGVGHPLRGDDYVGSYIAKRIIETTDGTLPDGAFILDAEGNVEALIMTLAGLGLKHVVFIDACEMMARPGETNLLSVTETSYPFFTTHGIPLKVLAERLLSKSEVWVLAIQPKQSEFGDRLSQELRSAANSISEFIATNLAEGGLATAD
jgi:hydrogenase 3 maturation protease